MSDSLAPVPFPATRRARLTWLGLLYFVQGLPFGVQVGILPVLLRTNGASRSTIAYASALALPWSLKFLIAPFVERSRLPGIGPRRSWILGMQLVASIAFAGLAATATSHDLAPILVAVFLANTAMAVLDVAVDGLAVDLLRDAELGAGNAAQVGGYKLGMLAAGGLAMQLLRWFDWSAVFGVMLLPIVAAFVVTWFAREPDERAPVVRGAIHASDVRRMAYELVSRPASRWLLVLLLGYKAGESLADAQFRPFLVDAGFTPEDIGILAGVFGAAASVLGSFVGGAVASRSRSLVRALFLVAAFRVLPLIAQASLAFVRPSAEAVLAVSLFEHFGGGMLTTVVFALMMSSVDRRFGATSFTLLATVETIGKGFAGFASGAIADRFGDRVVFSAAVLLSTLFLLLARPMSRHEAQGAYRREGDDVSAAS